MKKTKIFVLVIALALLVGSVIGMFARAEEAAPTPEIIGKNIRYGENLKFRIAVDGDSLGADKTVTVNFYDADPKTGVAPIDTATATYTDTSDKSKYNLDANSAYIAVSNYGISAIAYGQTFYITAECDGVVSEVLEYSAVEYFLERLYADADSITAIQKKHYENAIAYGSTAQLVTGDEKTNVADYLYVMAKDGKVNGKEGAVVLAGDALNFTYNGSEDVTSIAYWTDPNGLKSATATASGTYAPRFADFTFNDLSTSTVFTPSTMSSTGSKSVSLSDGDKDVSRYAGLLYGNIGSAGRTYSYSITDDGRLKYSTPQGGTALAFVNTNNVEDDRNYSNFEAEVQLDLGKNAEGTQLTSCTITSDLLIGTSNTIYRIVYAYNAATGRLKIYFQRNVAFAGVSYKDTSHYEVQIAPANTYSVSFYLQVENYYIAETKDAACVISINGKNAYIADSRAINYETDYPTNNDDIAVYRNSDGALVTPLAHYATSATDDTPKVANTFTGFYLNPNSGSICDIYFDNIIFEAKKLDEMPDINSDRVVK